MGSRLLEALGAEACQLLETEASTGFAATREACLYMERKGSAFITPAVAIDNRIRTLNELKARIYHDAHSTPISRLPA